MNEQKVGCKHNTDRDFMNTSLCFQWSMVVVTFWGCFSSAGIAGKVSLSFWNLWSVSARNFFKKWQEKPTRPPGSSLGYVRVTWKGGRGVLVPIWLEFECAWLILNTVCTLMQPQKKQLKSFLLSLAKDTNIKIQLSCAGYIGGHINGGKCFVKDIFLFHVFFFFGITKLYIFGCKGTAISFISFPRCNFVNTSPLVR